MAPTKPVTKATLVIGVMYKEVSVLDKALTLLKQRFGEIEDSLEYDFTFTDYYEDETGKGLKKRIMAFKDKIDRETLPDIKLWTNDLEQKFLREGNRQINIDPGYMAERNIVLATAKELPHRPLLTKGIYADVVLVYKNNTYMPHPRTFPDYKSERVIAFFNTIRKRLKEE